MVHYLCACPLWRLATLERACLSPWRKQLTMVYCLLAHAGASRYGGNGKPRLPLQDNNLLEGASSCHLPKTKSARSSINGGVLQCWCAAVATKARPQKREHGFQQRLKGTQGVAVVALEGVHVLMEATEGNCFSKSNSGSPSPIRCSWHCCQATQHLQRSTEVPLSPAADLPVRTLLPAHDKPACFVVFIGNLAPAGNNRRWSLTSPGVRDPFSTLPASPLQAQRFLRRDNSGTLSEDVLLHETMRSAVICLWRKRQVDENVHTHTHTHAHNTRAHAQPSDG
eukprot:scaffold160_cov18-Tisochrysis_lutea.AAC.3